VEEVLLFYIFFPIVDTCFNCEDIARQSCVMVPRWRIFGDFFCPVFSASRVQHVSDLHPKFALRPHNVWKYGKHPIYIQRLRLGEEKRRQNYNVGRCPTSWSPCPIQVAPSVQRRKVWLTPTAGVPCSKGQIALRSVVRSWFETGRRQVRSLFEACRRPAAS